MAAEPKEKQKATEAGGGAGTAEGDAGAKTGDELNVKMKPNLDAQAKTVKTIKEFEGSR